MIEIEQIMKSKAKPKEKLEQLVEANRNGCIGLEELLAFYKSAKDPEKSTLLSAIAQITKDNPEFIKNQIDFVIDQIAYKAPRVKWESPEIIASITEKFPEKTALAIPDLTGNIDNEGIVVQCSTANALTAIAKHNKKTLEQLFPLFEEQLEKEENNGVRKIYEKALKTLKNQNK
jgi:hypothetical protein